MRNATDKTVAACHRRARPGHAIALVPLLLLALSSCTTSGEVLVPIGGDSGQGGADGGADVVIPPKKVQRIDLLLMIDNSASMADKQDLLGQSVPDLMTRLANPQCIDSQTGKPVVQPAKPLDPCPEGSAREFNPVLDMHVAVITSSLGGHGADSCSNVPTAQYNPRMEDMSHLISRGPTVNQTVPTWQSKGFLFWDPSQVGTPPGEADYGALSTSLASLVTGAGQDGCGFESSLEAWYRFLVDPAPYQTLVPYNCLTNQPEPSSGQCRGPQGVDSVVLTQRADFLRPDSLVAIVMLTDEDDCSVKDASQNYIALQAYSGQNPWHLPRATSACATDPASANCMSCVQGDFSSDPECSKGLYYSDIEDSLNLRCYRQKQRFGIDFLHPTARYVHALTNPFFTKDKVNPLFCTAPTPDGMACTTPMRDPSQILLGAIVGVPWQDLARDPNDISKGYRPAIELPWDVIAGDLEHYKDPSDPLMIPSVTPRSGTNPFTQQPVADFNASSPTANVINGHEWDIKGQNDLQYACIFKLPTPRDCSANTSSCDCAEADGLNNPLCQSDDGSYGKLQYRAKAYPAVRILSVLKGLGSRAMVGSICAAETGDSASSIYGYRPAAQALVEAMRPSL
ncbi:MAG: hypothetical protein HY898_01860 [Deltaproteobacteria bacterium]|nr:hypothetical protein [Deltaproteobacteria bacterium]